MTDPTGSGPVAGCFSSGQRPVNWVSVSTRLGHGSVASSQLTDSGSPPFAVDPSAVSVTVWRMTTNPPGWRAMVDSSRIALTASSAVMLSAWPSAAALTDVPVQRA